MAGDARRDEELIELYYSCNDQAFEAIYERYRPHLHLWFSRWGVRDFADREDLQQKTMLRVAATKDRRRQRFRRTHAFRAWVFTIARNLWRTFWRKRRRRPESQLQDDLPSFSKDSPDDLDFLLWLLTRLKDEEQLIVMLRYLEGLTLKEIAEGVNRSVAWVNDHLKQAERELQLIGQEFKVSSHSREELIHMLRSEMNEFADGVETATKRELIHAIVRFREFAERNRS